MRTVRQDILQQSVNANDYQVFSRENKEFLDAEMLAYLALETVFVRASNGRYYWYYVFQDIKMASIIEHLFHRNGIYPRLHYSHYLHNRRFNPVYRIRSHFVMKNPKVTEFVSLIKATGENICVENDIESRLSVIERRLKQKTR